MTQPIKMIMKESPVSAEREVIVFDFIHNTETLETYALCWVDDTEMWMTVPVYCVSPIQQKQKLNG